ncbi:energy transducer TonB [bacterium]|nr:energy transducer TonB [bacterium]
MVIFSNPEATARWPDLCSIRILSVALLVSLASHAAVLIFTPPRHTAAQLPLESSVGRIWLEVVEAKASERRTEPERQTSRPAPPMAEPAVKPVEEIIPAAAVGPKFSRSDEPALESPSEPTEVTQTAGSAEEGTQDMRVVLPAYSHNPPPDYPIEARRRWAEGLVLLKVRISETGGVLAVSVDKTSDFSLLDGAALDAVRRWKFVPAMRGAKPIEGICVVPVEFSLKEGVRVK